MWDLGAPPSHRLPYNTRAGDPEGGSISFSDLEPQCGDLCILALRPPPVRRVSGRLIQSLFWRCRQEW